MNKASKTLNRFFLYAKEKYNLLLFLISIVALTFTLLNILGDGELPFSNPDYLLFNKIFQLATIMSSIFTILFLPSYPIFFSMWKNTKFNFLEKLSTVIMFNLCFYILCGYMGFYIGFSITGLFFFGCVILFYFSSLIIIFIREWRKNGFIISNPFKSKLKTSESISNYSFTSWFNNHRNTFLLVLFLFLLCSFYVVRYSFFFGTDGWLHIGITKMITDMGIIPTNEWLGVFGIHIYSAVIYFFSSIDLILLPRYFVFYTFFVSSLIFYNIQMRIFKNRNLAVLGVFILQFFSLGFTHIMVQFWPTSLATMLCLEIFFLLYLRIQDFIKQNRPQRSDIFSNMLGTYIVVVIFFITSILTHLFVSLIMLLSFLSIYVIYFLKDFNRGFDFALLCGLLGITLIFNSSGMGLDFLSSLLLIDVPWYYYVAGGIAGGIGVVIILRQIIKSLSFTNGGFKASIQGESNKYYKIIEDKYIYPLCLVVILFFIVIFLVGIISSLDVNPSKTLLGIESAILVFFSLWGLLIFQKKPRGKVLMLWLLSFFLLYGVVFLLDIDLGGRVAILAAPAISIGFISYFYKLQKLNSSGNLKISLFILVLTIFSFFSFFYDDLIDPDLNEYDIKKREVAVIHTFSLYNSGRSVIITEFGWGYIFIYYDYPYDQSNGSLSGSDIHQFMQTNQEYFHPSNHFNGSVNVLQQMKRDYGVDIYIIPDDVFLDVINGGVDRLTQEELDQYNNMNYMNKIMVSTSESGEEVSLYCVT